MIDMNETPECKDCKRVFDSEEALAQHKAAKHPSGSEQRAKTKGIRIRVRRKTLITYLVLIVIVSLTAYGFYSIAGGSSGTDGLISSGHAPDFTLPSTNGGNVTLSNYTSRGNVLLYFQEGIGCQACWSQLIDMQNDIAQFNALNVTIITITTDPIDTLTSYVSQMGITLPVLSDAGGQVSNKYGAMVYSMHPGQTPGHSFVLVNRSGDIIWSYDAYRTDGVMYVPVDSILEGIRTALH